MRSSLKALRSLETIKIFCSNENNNTSLCSRSLMTLFFLFSLSLVLLKIIIMFLGVKVRKRSKKWQRKQAAFFSKNRRRDKTLIKSHTTVSSHTKKEKKNSNHRHSSHHGAEFFLLEQRLVHEDIRADTSQRSRCVRYTLRALSLSFYFSLSRPRRTAGIIIIDAFRGRDYTSD